MKHKFDSFRWISLLLLTVFLMSGCKIWDPRTWGFKPRAKNVQRWRYEAATPYAGLTGQPDAANRLIAVSGMGIDGSVAFFTADGRRVVSESAPAVPAPAAQAPAQPAATASEGGLLAGLDDQVRRERFGQSFAEYRIRGTDAGTGQDKEAPPSPPDPFANLPAGIPVPGKPGFVNLPEPYSGLPQVDVRGIAADTPVEVPNPLQSGEKIRFRVP